MEIGIIAVIYAILKQNTLMESTKILIACTFTVFMYNILYLPQCKESLI